MPVKSYGDLVAVIVFLKEHPLVNEKVLEYAATATIINRADVATDIISPLEVRGILQPGHVLLCKLTLVKRDSTRPTKRGKRLQCLKHVIIK